MNRYQHHNEVAACIHPRWTMGFFTVVLLAFILSLGGCLSRPPLNKQTFAFSVPALTVANETASSHILAIRRLEISPPFDSRSLIYRTGEFSYERDSYAEFLGSPAEELKAAAGGLLTANGCCSAVVNAGSAVKPDLLVEINVSQLYGDIRQPGSPAAVLAMQVVFMEATNGLSGRVILQRNYSLSIPIKSTKPAALMEGWNRALVEIFTEIAKTCRAQETQ